MLWGRHAEDKGRQGRHREDREDIGKTKSASEQAVVSDTCANDYAYMRNNNVFRTDSLKEFKTINNVVFMECCLPCVFPLSSLCLPLSSPVFPTS